MQENKEKQIKFRLTASQEQQVKDYCAAQNITVSELMREALKEYFKK